VFEVPRVVRELIARGRLGEKTGAGFYRRVTDDTPAGPVRRIEVLDLDTFEYRPRRDAHFPSLDRARRAATLPDRLRTLAWADDPAGRFVWHVLSRVLVYAAVHAEEIAGGDLAAIDRALRAGYEWELGPFETWAALGLKNVTERLLAEGQSVPDFVLETVASGKTEFYDGDSTETSRWALPAVWRLDRPHSPVRRVRSLESSTLVDLGEDVLGCLVQPDHHAIGPSLISDLHEVARETEAHWRGLVISAPSRQRFLIGANLALVLATAEEGDFDTLDHSVRALQTVYQELRYLPRPVVVAPLGMTLGGGAELCLAADAVVTSLDWVVGQVEIGAGLIPAGGGITALLRRTLTGILSGSSFTWAPFLAQGSVKASVGSTLFVDPAPAVSQVFQILATARTAQSAAEAREIGFLTECDRVVPNPEGLLDEARDHVLGLDRVGYRPPMPAVIPAPGREVRALLEVAIQSLKQSGFATKTDAHIAGKLAWALTGGDVSMGTPLPEQRYLDLEREGFLALSGESTSQARMRALLETGKPLRN
jgi:3-hydroxyacyl-CoA dehydrogenase